MQFHDPVRPKLGSMPLFMPEGTPTGVLPVWSIMPTAEGGFRLFAYFSTGSGRAQQVRTYCANLFDLNLFLHFWVENPEAVAIACGWKASGVSPSPKARSLPDITLEDLDLNL